MSLLDHPEAQALLADAVLTPEAVRGCEDRLAAFLGALPAALPPGRAARQRHRSSSAGLLSGLQRKTCEPIAVEAGVHRKPIQFLVGAGKWDDEAVMAELRRHVAEELGDDRAVLVIDATHLPQDRGRLVRRGPPVVRPAGQAGELPARRSSWPTPPPAATPRWTAGSTCPRTGPATPPAGRSATSPRRSSSGRAGGSPPT